MKPILVIHGPNLNLLGSREPSVYGRVRLSEINALLRRAARSRKVRLTIVQSNHEGEIVDCIHKGMKNNSAILINPAAYTHTSVAIRDSLAACIFPVVEVHLSNIHSREAFRRTSLVTPVVKGTIMGFGPASYTLGLHALMDLLEKR